MTRTLNVRFSASALETLAKQGKKLILVKESNERSPRGNSVIAWFTTTPFGNVKISWDEDFYLYGTRTEFRDGEIIKKTVCSDNSVRDGGYCYQFGPHRATFNAERHSGQRGVIYMENQFRDEEVTLFGLAQKIRCDSKTMINPINVVKGTFKDSLEFRPVERIQVFLQANVQDGKVISNISSDTIRLDFTNDTEKSITYDADRNTFVRD